MDKVKAAEYRHILAWGLMMGSDLHYIRGEQRVAAFEGAPIDAIYQDADWNEGRWHRFSEVTSEDTIKRIEQILEDIK